jgi:hypothetical protein
MLMVPQTDIDWRTMRKICVVVFIGSLALTGCTAVLTSVSPAGVMNEAGAIQPCRPDRRDAQACGNAIFNATVIAEIHKGQSRTNVRGIMRHDAERREVVGLTESWGYMTSYRNKMITWITFTDHQVSSLSHEAVRRD